jgi:hypothetical protein
MDYAYEKMLERLNVSRRIWKRIMSNPLSRFLEWIDIVGVIWLKYDCYDSQWNNVHDIHSKGLLLILFFCWYNTNVDTF